MLEQQDLPSEVRPFPYPGSRLATACLALFTGLLTGCPPSLPDPPADRSEILRSALVVSARAFFLGFGAGPLSPCAGSPMSLEPAANVLLTSTTTPGAVVVCSSVETLPAVALPIITCFCEHHEQCSLRGLKGSAYHFSASSKRQCVRRALATVRAGLKSERGMIDAPGAEE